MQREALHLPVLHAYSRGPWQTEEQGWQKTGQHRERESEDFLFSVSLSSNWSIKTKTDSSDSPPDSVPASERSVRAAVEGVCGTGLLRGSFPLSKPVCGLSNHGRCAFTYWRLRLQVQQLPGTSEQLIKHEWDLKAHTLGSLSFSKQLKVKVHGGVLEPEEKAWEIILHCNTHKQSEFTSVSNSLPPK